jgi:hypothetical protein
MSAYIRSLAVARRQRDEFVAQRERLIAEARGDIGPAPAHEWDGTRLRFQNPDGSWGEWVDLRGKPGKPGKDGISVVGGGGYSAGGASFSPSALPPLESSPVDTDALVLSRDGRSYRVTVSAMRALSNYVDEKDMQYTTRVDVVDETLMYIGDAAPGTIEAAAEWRIKRIVTGVDGDMVGLFALGTADFVHTWDDRAALTYS